MSETRYNVIRKQRGNVTIVFRNLPQRDAVIELKNLKRRARDAHSNVFFDLVVVPEEVGRIVPSTIWNEVTA